MDKVRWYVELMVNGCALTPPVIRSGDVAKPVKQFRPGDDAALYVIFFVIK